MSFLSKLFAVKSSQRVSAAPASKVKSSSGERFSLFEKLEGRSMFSVVTPTPPDGLTAKVSSSTAIKITWNDNSTRESGYKIERSTDGKTFSQINTAAANTESYTSGGLAKNKKYYFRVRGYNAGGNSVYTNVASAVTGAASAQSTGGTSTGSSSNKAVASGSYEGINVNTDVSPSRIIPILRDLHVKSVRLYFGMKTWANRGGDLSIQQAAAYHAAGFKVMMQINAADVPSYGEAAGFFNYLKNNSAAMKAVDLWQIGNEPNRAPSWKGTASQYVNNVLKAAWDVLHPAGAKLVGAAPTFDVAYAQSLVDAGYLKYCDYAGFHPYGNSVQQVLDRAKGAADVYNGKPVIFSEWNIRGATSQSDWISKINQIAPKLAAYADIAFYFCLVKANTLAGPGGLLTTSLGKNGGYYDAYKSWAE